MKCPLCADIANHFYTHKHREFYFCSSCFSVFLDTKNYMSESDEKKHYEFHNNDVNDKGYQQFASPIVRAVLDDFTPKHSGLDFGAGTNSVIVKLLKDKKYNIVEYDPFFSNHPEVLEKQYDYITCCEVIEHFHHPFEEFKKLFQLLKPGGKLICMTDFFSETQNFDTWYYKNDHSHVFFYHPKTMEWISKNIGFSSYTIEGRVTVFER
ncbi:MAG: class I SAM-dependent methyltransferase [Flavobacterium sp.]|jgi:SAM-dependent methyltransferase|uniref:class I SAM-dependent methyltransferase n=1 Tax=Flavobacterium sp. TaxID=239 RepID=UPI003BA525A4